MKKYEEMNSKELREEAKGNHIKNWWNLKKADMVKALNDIKNTQTKMEVPVVSENVENTEIHPYAEMIHEINDKLLKKEKEQKEIKKPKNKIKKSKVETVSKITKGMIAPKVEDENIVTLGMILNDLSKEGYDIKGTKARRILRKAASIKRPFKTWKWDKEEHKDIINEVKALLTK